MVCICARDDDTHAARVAGILESRHAQDVFVFDTSQFPEAMSLSATFGSGNDARVLATAARGPIPLDGVRSIWWRRPQPMALESRITDEASRSFVFQECVSALYGVLGCCDALWVNDLKSDAAAEYKPYQLKVASEMGFAVPATLITNDPAQVCAFWHQHRGAVVYKSFNQRGLVWTPTRLLTRADLDLVKLVKHSPVIFQAFVPGVRDLRVTVVGDTVFATEFDIEHTDAIDHRLRLDDLPCRPCRLPPDVESRTRALMRRLGLEYGGIDFRLTPSGEYVFFEINTAGEFLYIQSRSSQPIAEEVAALLARGTPTAE